MRTSANEDLGTPGARTILVTGYEPNDLHISETTHILIQESSSYGNPLNLHDLEFDDCTIGDGALFTIVQLGARRTSAL